MYCYIHLLCIYYHYMSHYIADEDMRISVILLLLLLLKKIGNARLGEGDDTLSVRGPQPHTTNQ